MHLAQPGALGGDRRHLRLERLVARLRNEPERVAHRRQALVGVVLPQQEPVLGAARQHAVGVADVLGDQVIDHRADVAVLARQHDGREPECPARGVDAGDDALGRGLLVARGAVDLPSGEEAGRGLGHQRRRQLGRGDAVVFDGVAVAQDFGVLEAGDGFDEGFLHVFRQAGGEALQVHDVLLLAFRLDEHRVGLFVLEPHDLVFDARAVTRADALDGAGVDGAAVEVLEDDAVGLGRRVRQPAGVLRLGGRGRLEGEVKDLVGAAVCLQLAVIDRVRRHARGRAGLEAMQLEAQGVEALGELHGRGLVAAAGDEVVLADVALAAQEGAGGDDHGLGGQHLTGGGDGAVGVVGLALQHVDHAFEQVQVGLLLANAAHVGGVALLVGLGAQGLDGRALGRVEHLDLQVGGVGRQAHLAAEGVHLAHEVALGRAADRRVARHGGDLLEADGGHERARAEPGRSQAGFHARVARADHQNVPGRLHSSLFSR
ncbi:hypothetical protein D3C72_960700 [compost metagenome]